MTRAWETLDSVSTDRGELELRRRGESDFLITLAGRILMTSSANRSEIALAEVACAPLMADPAARVLIGGLGMAYTLRAALDSLSDSAQVVVAELHPRVADWCQGPMAPLTNSAASDSRVEIEFCDVARLIKRSSRAPEPPDPPGAATPPASGRGFDAILLDLYEGPRGGSENAHPHYGHRALDNTRDALRKGGVFAVWSEDPDTAFERRLRRAGFKVERKRPGRGGRRHAVYIATRS